MCAPERIERATTSTSSWTAAVAIISGVWCSPVYTTSNPASRSARATTLAPRSCPSRPGLATRMRIFRSSVDAAASVMQRSALVDEVERRLHRRRAARGGELPPLDAAGDAAGEAGEVVLGTAGADALDVAAGPDGEGDADARAPRVRVGARVERGLPALAADV